jgi:hypothetical protein
VCPGSSIPAFSSSIPAARLPPAPAEANNLAAEWGQRDRVADLLGRLEKRQKQYGDHLPPTAANARPGGPVTPEQLRQLAKPAGKK